MTRNDADQAIDYTQCYIAFLDILGFKELVRRSMDGATLRAALVRALKEVASLSPTQHSKQHVTYHKDGTITTTPWKDWTTQIRAFSDSVVLFIPVESNGLTSLLCKVRYLHDRLLELTCCVRGAVTIGDMYWDDAWGSAGAAGGVTGIVSAALEKICGRKHPPNGFITLGPGLIDAYTLESQVANYPRVIFSRPLMTHINVMSRTPPENPAQGIHKAVDAAFLCLPCPENDGRCITDFIREDVDGVPFLDMFHRDINRDDVVRIERETHPNERVVHRWVRNGMTHQRFMERSRATIEEFLRESNADRVRAKHLWLANYFNSAVSHLNIAPLKVEWSPSDAQD